MRISDWSSDVCSSDLLVAGAPLSQEALADLTEDLDAIMGADLGAAQCLCELRTDIRIVQFALGGVGDRAATAVVYQRVYHLVLVFEIMGTNEEIGRRSCREGGWQ